MARPGGMKPQFIRLVLAALLAAGCATAASPSPTGTSGTPGPGASASPAGSPAASPAATRMLSQAELRIRLIDRFGPLWYCDPDFWPVAREDEAALAISRWPEVSADAATLAAIVAHLGLRIGAGTPTDAQKLAIYREWKVLRAIALEPIGADRFRFDYLATPTGGAQEGTRSKGTIDNRGSITVESSVRAQAPNCPICLARGQPIDTPAGPVPVEALRLGDPVWSLDAAGVRTAAAVIALGSTPVPAGHEVIQLRLADGRTLLASPGHPLADGRRLGDLRPGDLVAGIAVVAVERTGYLGAETFDLLASGPTGAYAVDGIWLNSTLLASPR